MTMKKVIKWFVVCIILIIILIFIALGLCIYFINPNDFKPIIAYQFKKYLHYEITIDGDLAWTFFPMLNIEAGHIHVQSLPDAKQFISVDAENTTIQIKLNPLLHKQIEISGVRIKGGHLNYNGLELTNIHLQSSFINNLLVVNPITANLYQGTLVGKITIDFGGAKPTLAADADLKHIQTDEFFNALSHKKLKININAFGDANISVNTSGKDTKAMVKNLMGSGQINFKNGILTGVNLDSIIDRALVLLKEKPALLKENNQTVFDQLNGTIQIQNGNFLNDDLLITSQLFVAHGHGKIDLPSHWINYLLSITIQKNLSNNLVSLTNTAIPVAIRGELNDPTVSLDAGQFLKELTVKQWDRLNPSDKEKLKEKIQQAVPGKAGQLLQQLIR